MLNCNFLEYCDIVFNKNISYNRKTHLLCGISFQYIFKISGIHYSQRLSTEKIQQLKCEIQVPRRLGSSGQCFYPYHARCTGSKIIIRQFPGNMESNQRECFDI